MMAVSKYSGLEERMGELEAHVRQQQGADTGRVLEVNSQSENHGCGETAAP